MSKFIHTATFNKLFDFVEFICQQDNCSTKLKVNLANSFVDTYSAYRLIDSRYVVAIGNEEQVATYLVALEIAAKRDASGPRAHLINAGRHIADQSWNDSVRESIHAVESVARKLVPKTQNLEKALEPVIKRNLMIAQLVEAVGKLYAYTNSENGIRHAFLFDTPEAKVDETDALFMLGTCASFVSYLLSRSTQL